MPRWVAFNARGKVQRLHVNNTEQPLQRSVCGGGHWNTCCHLLAKWKCRKSFDALAKWSPLLRPVSHFYIALLRSLHTFSSNYNNNKNNVACERARDIDAFNLLPNKSKTNKRIRFDGSRCWLASAVETIRFDLISSFNSFFSSSLWPPDFCLFLHLPASVVVYVSIPYWRFVAIFPIEVFLNLFFTIPNAERVCASHALTD